MEFKLKQEYPEADLDNIETMKQIVINKFTEHGLPIIKIRSGRLPGKEKGIYVYHRYGTEHYQNKREIVSRTENTVTYRRYKKAYNVSFIGTEDIEDFTNMLEMTIMEGLRRKEDT